MTSSNTHYDQGLALRHAMFGAEFTDRQIADASDFVRPIQDLVTQQCFGEVWTRPGLDRRTRSLLTIAMLIGLGRSHELRTHVKGAISNGVSKEEIREILLHAMLYVGLPAASDSWRQATAALKEIGAY